MRIWDLELQRANGLRGGEGDTHRLQTANSVRGEMSGARDTAVLGVWLVDSEADGGSC